MWRKSWFRNSHGSQNLGIKLKNGVNRLYRPSCRILVELLKRLDLRFGELVTEEGGSSLVRALDRRTRVRLPSGMTTRPPRIYVLPDLPLIDQLRSGFCEILQDSY